MTLERPTYWPSRPLSLLDGPMRAAVGDGLLANVTYGRKAGATAI